MSDAHEFRSKQKDEWRRRTVDFYRLSPMYRNHKLHGAVVETAGSSGCLSFEQTKGLLISPKQFVLVDLRSATWLKIAKEILSDYPNAEDRPVLKKGEAVGVTLEMLRNGSPVAALNLDVCDMVGSTSWWANFGGPLKDAIVRGVKLSGSFALVLNHTLDVPPNCCTETTSERVKQHVRNVCCLLNGVTPERLLGRNPIDEVDLFGQRNITGRIGAFDIYVGERLRMATLRVVVERDRVNVECEPIR